MNADSETVLYSSGTALWDGDSRPCLIRRARASMTRGALKAVLPRKGIHRLIPFEYRNYKFPKLSSLFIFLFT